MKWSWDRRRTGPGCRGWNWRSVGSARTGVGELVTTPLLWQVQSFCLLHPLPVPDSSDSKPKPLRRTLQKVTSLKKRGLAVFLQLIPKIALIATASKAALWAAGRLQRGARRTFWERVPLGSASARTLPHSWRPSSFLPLPFSSPPFPFLLSNLSFSFSSTFLQFF